MAGFDACGQKIRGVVVKIGKALYPEVSDISHVLGVMDERFNLGLGVLRSVELDHLPGPSETGPYYKCPECGSVSAAVFELCRGCADSEGGRFKAKVVCVRCNYVAYREERVVKVLEGLGAEFGAVPKAALGVRTIKDEGVI